MKYSIKYFVSSIMLMVATALMAQGTFSKGDIIVKTAPSPHKGRVVLKSIENIYDTTVNITFINDYEKVNKQKSDAKPLKKGEKKNWDITFNAIIVQPVNSDKSIEIYRVKKEIASEESTKYISAQTLIENFLVYLDSITTLSSQRLREDSAVISRHIVNLNLPSIDKSAYVKDEKLDEFIKNYTDSIYLSQSDSSMVVAACFARFGMVEKKDSCEKVMFSIMRERIEKKAEMIASLKSVVDKNTYDKDEVNWKIIIVCGGGVLLCLLLIIWYRKVNQNRKGKNKDVARKGCDTNSNTGAEDAPALIVVGSKSTPILKKQTLDDVYDNESYLKIDSDDFCGESMVRTIYIKNSCVKDIYNMYAEDLRNPDNPKEDGCMVIGRWIYDEKIGKYDVSLEYTVLPGDDAVFAEFELNFGGKIKLKMSDKLRKLRRDTGLQYDLTCWVHSHPGLGVFFSNSDNNVHHQLKHPSYSGFLTAFVIDILTPQQDMGIFTFRNADEVNSKSDIIKLYSLEEMYKWALESERRSFDTNDYFDILGDAKEHLALCYGVQLSNSAIIDMTFLTTKPNGFYGFVHGYLLKRGERTQCVVSVVNSNESAPNTNMLGCFVVASHCSIPSIRKVIFRYLRDIHFVLVYTVSDGLLTVIPIVDNDLVNNEAYYGEKELEDLKIWTRRRR